MSSNKQDLISQTYVLFCAECFFCLFSKCISMQLSNASTKLNVIFKLIYYWTVILLPLRSTEHFTDLQRKKTILWVTVSSSEKSHTKIHCKIKVTTREKKTQRWKSFSRIRLFCLLFSLLSYFNVSPIFWIGWSHVTNNPFSITTFFEL